jgi:hypothetical protein
VLSENFYFEPGFLLQEILQSQKAPSALASQGDGIRNASRRKIGLFSVACGARTHHSFAAYVRMFSW